MLIFTSGKSLTGPDSPDFAPMENELRIYWIRLGRFLVATLKR
jgi:hypothetical protein